MPGEIASRYRLQSLERPDGHKAAFPAAAGPDPAGGDFSLFASNFVGETAMSAVALFGPINMLIYSISFMLFSGATILCGTYMGRNQFDKVQGLFSVDLALALIVSVVSVLGMAMIAVFDWSGFLTRDEAVRPVFNAYLLGQAIGELPYILGNPLSCPWKIKSAGPPRPASR